MFKHILALGIIFFLSISTFAQIQNGDFENWTNNNPDNWFTLDVLGIVDGVTQTNDNHGGNSAARLEVIEFNSQPFIPFLQNSYGDTSSITISTRYENLMGYYKLSTLGGDRLTIIVTLFNNTSGALGGGQIDLQGTISSYTQFSVPMEYFSEDMPDNAIIQIALADSSGEDQGATIGSWAILDDLEFSGVATSVEDNTQIPRVYSLSNNYPNPFNPSTTIGYTIPQDGHVTLSVYDVLGNEVVVLENEYKSADSYSYNFDASKQTSGIYFYRLQAGDFVETKKMILIK